MFGLLPSLTPFRLMTFRTAHKPAGWSLLTLFKTFEDSTIWTWIGLKLRPEGAVKKLEIPCTMYSRKEVSVKKRKGVSEMAAWTLNLRRDIREFYALADHDY